VPLHAMAHRLIEEYLALRNHGGPGWCEPGWSRPGRRKRALRTMRAVPKNPSLCDTSRNETGIPATIAGTRLRASSTAGCYCIRLLFPNDITLLLYCYLVVILLRYGQTEGASHGNIDSSSA